MSASPVPSLGQEAVVAGLRQDVDERAAVTPDSFSVLGQRDDLGGRGVRYRHGLLPGGIFGTEIFTSDGKRNRNGKWAAEVFFFAGASPPEGCEEADGATVDPTEAEEKYLYLARGMGLSESTPFAKPNGRGRVLVGKATSGTFVTLRAMGGAETASDSVNVSVSGSVSGGSVTIAHTHTYSGTTSGSASQPVADGASSTAAPAGHAHTFSGTTSGASVASGNLTGATFTDSGSDSVLVSTLQPYLILLACVAL